MNKLYGIEINIDQLRSNFLWFEDALANGYKDNCHTQKDHCFQKQLLRFTIREPDLTYHNTKTRLNEILEERSKGKPFERKRSERHINFVFRMK